MSTSSTPLVIGLTGGIGSGKSFAAQRFKALGAGLVDADAISRSITTAGGEAVPLIEAAFGSAFVTKEGAMDRAAMRELVFAEPEARAKLEGILHPVIANKAAQAIVETGERAPYVLYDCPLIAEKPALAERVSRILVVDAPKYLQVKRVMRRSGLTKDACEAIVAAQASRRARLAMACDVLVNAGTPEALYARIERLHSFYLTLRADS